MSNNEPVLAGVAQRYATALFELALEGKGPDGLDGVAGELDSLKALLEASDDLKYLVSSPLIGREGQARAMAAVLVEAKAGQLVQKFVGLVAAKGRLGVLADMIKAFQGLLSRHRGEISAEVTSAVTLKDEQLSALKASLRQALGRDVQLQTQVDESLIGGLIVKVGSRMIDSSLKTKLGNLKIAMKEVG